jgi:hypothetical protein
MARSQSREFLGSTGPGSATSDVPLPDIREQYQGSRPYPD